MTSSLHDILNSLSVARAHAEIIADEIEQADPQGAAVFRKFAEELWDVWTRNYPVMPTNKDIYSLLKHH